MRKILIVIPGLNHGGTNRSLANLLEVIDNKKYDIDILNVFQHGPYKKIFEKYKLLSPEYIFGNSCLLRVLLKVHIPVEIRHKIISYYLSMRVHFFKKSFFRSIGNRLKSKNYDVAVSFQEGFVTELTTYIPAKKHIAWVRCDYSRYMDLVSKDETDIYRKYDNIVGVSQYTANVIKKCMPVIAPKVMAIYNLIDYKKIIESSFCDIDDNRFKNDVLTLISIGRMDPVKRFSYIPEIAQKLKNHGVSFRWYIIGSGGAEECRVKEKIAEKGVEDYVMLLGSKINPYPYIRASSILVCPSLSEACPNVVNEGRILHIPVITADFPSAPEFITNGVNGYVVPIEEIANIVEHLYIHKDVYAMINKNIQGYIYDNYTIKRNIEQLLDMK